MLVTYIGLNWNLQEGLIQAMNHGINCINMLESGYPISKSFVVKGYNKLLPREHQSSAFLHNADV